MGEKFINILPGKDQGIYLGGIDRYILPVFFAKGFYALKQTTVHQKGQFRGAQQVLGAGHGFRRAERLQGDFI